jgi:hypothetical protein
LIKGKQQIQQNNHQEVKTSRKSTSFRRFIGLYALLIIPLILIVRYAGGGCFNRIATNLDAAFGDKLWTEGHKKEAVDEYKHAIDKFVKYGRVKLEPRIFERAIEYEIEHESNNNNAELHIKIAVKANIALSLKSEKAIKLFSQIKHNYK